MNVNECSGRTLAFLGDAAWSLCVRQYLIEHGYGKGKRLQKESVSFVSANAQADFYAKAHAANFFTEEEEEIFHRGRNANTGSVAKNADILTYRTSTGFEAVLGALQLEGKTERIAEIFAWCVENRGK